MYVSDSNLAGELAALGNIPGLNQGDCLFSLPGGMREVVASASMWLYAEGLTGQLKDGRRFFAHIGGAVVVDAPQQEAPA